MPGTRGAKTIAVTLGDPAGIGSEVIAKAFAVLAERWQTDQAALHGLPVVIGPEWAVQQGIELTGVPLTTRRINSVAAAEAVPGCIQVLEPPVVPAAGEDETAFTQPTPWGEVSAVAGRWAVTAVEFAAGLAASGAVDAMVTCPINKEAVHAAGYLDDIGHQEILSRLTGATLTATMLMTTGLRVAHLSTHKSLGEAVRFVTRGNVLAKIRLTHDSLTRWGIADPLIAVAALNPHGGEGGLLGREEIEQLMPAVADAQAAGMSVVGPLPADSVFNRAIAGEFEAVLALYHDQGHIAIKVHNFTDSITATMGIPFIRTSVDHGTAFDIAGKGVADHNGLLQAMAAADQLVNGTLPALRVR